MNWNELKDLYKHDNEIGSHTHTHPHLNELSDSELDFELKKSKALLSSFKCNTLAYPFGEHDERVINYARRYYVAARGYYDITMKSRDYGYNFGSIHEVYKLKVAPTEHTFPLQSVPLLELPTSKFQKLVAKIINNSIEKKAWAIFVFHGQQDMTPKNILDNIYKQTYATVKSAIHIFDLTKIFVHNKEKTKKFRWMCEYLASNDQIRIFTISEVIEYLFRHHRLPLEVKSKCAHACMNKTNN